MSACIQTPKEKKKRKNSFIWVSDTKPWSFLSLWIAHCPWWQHVMHTHARTVRSWKQHDAPRADWCGIYSVQEHGDAALMAARAEKITRLPLHRPGWLFSETGPGCSVIRVSEAAAWLCCHTRWNLYGRKTSEEALQRVAVMEIQHELAWHSLERIPPPNSHLIWAWAATAAACDTPLVAHWILINWATHRWLL